MAKELIVLVDESDNELGTAEKLTAHTGDTQLHRAFSCYIFNQEGKFLRTRRAQTKKVWPGVLTNSVCGHPGPGESYEDAILRRAKFELGVGEVNGIVKLIPEYMYKTHPYNGIVEHEFCPVFAARTTGEPSPNPDEVDEYAWVDWQEYLAAALNDTEDVYSYWTKDQLRIMRDTEEISDELRKLTTSSRL